MRREFYDRPGWRRAAIPYARIALVRPFSPDCVPLRTVGCKRRLRQFRQLRQSNGGSELVHARVHHPVPCLGRDHLRIVLRPRLDHRHLAALGVSLGSAVLLALFGIAMAISGGIKDPPRLLGLFRLSLRAPSRLSGNQNDGDETMNLNKPICLSLLLTTLTFAQAAPADDSELLKIRETVWRAWFANDKTTLARLVPAETIVITASEKEWKHQTEVLKEAAEFQTDGGKLLRLNFPDGSAALRRRRDHLEHL